jgi:hypothetical protein
MEGPPGAGKSFTVCNYIKREYARATGTAFFVATATHLTLKPYMSLDAMGSRTPHPDTKNSIQVCTVHSLIGVYKKMKEACEDPHAWFSERKNAIRSRFMSALGNSNTRKVVIFIDEYEMLPLCMEEMLLYMSMRPNVRVILLGDKYQTAAFGRGIRCDGDVVTALTGGRCIEFDLPFRNPDYATVVAMRKACGGKPTMFLEPFLSDYSLISSRRDDVYQTELDRIAMAYCEAAVAGVPYKDPVISLQNYKAICVVTLDIVARVHELNHLGTEDAVAFCGTNSYGMGESPEDPLGSVDADTDGNTTETVRMQQIGGSVFSKRLNHMTGDPHGKGFLVGTMVCYRTGYSYRS